VNSEHLVRKASVADAAAIAILINTAFRVEQFFIDTDRITIAEVNRRLLTGAFLLAESDGALVGCVYLEVRGARAYLGLLSVMPSEQRSGVGSRLMRAAEDLARQNQCGFVDLQVVNLRNELPDFYKRQGYVVTGIEPFPAEVKTKLPCHFVTMAKPLDVL
jgi:N-acetylglutamate synthase-like GNAT family acetyltransferase